MSDRSQDELRKRFDHSRDKESDDTSDTSDASGSFEMNKMNKTGETNECGGERSESGNSGLTEHKQVAMYLPQDHPDDLADLYDELDSRSKLARDGEFEKNREFYEALVKFAIEKGSSERHSVSNSKSSLFSIFPVVSVMSVLSHSYERLRVEGCFFAQRLYDFIP